MTRSQDQQPANQPERPDPERALHLLKVLAQPVRMKILHTMLFNKPMRVSDLATAVDEPVGSVSYHLRQLAGVDIVHQTEPHEGGDRRESWWVINDWNGLVIDPDAIRAQPGGSSVLTALDQIQSAYTTDLFSIPHIEAAEATGRPMMNATGGFLLTDDQARTLLGTIGRAIDDARDSSRNNQTTQNPDAHHYEGQMVILPSQDSPDND